MVGKSSNEEELPPALLNALRPPANRRVIEFLVNQPKGVSLYTPQIAEALGMHVTTTRSAISALNNTGILDAVEDTKIGKPTKYSVKRDCVRKIKKYLDQPLEDTSWRNPAEHRDFMGKVMREVQYTSGKKITANTATGKNDKSIGCTLLYISAKPPTEQERKLLRGTHEFNIEHSTKIPKTSIASLIIIDGRGRDNDVVSDDLMMAKDIVNSATGNQDIPLFVIGDPAAAALFTEAKQVFAPNKIDRISNSAASVINAGIKAALKSR